MFNELCIICEDETEYRRVRELFAEKGLSWASGDSLVDEDFEDNIFEFGERDVLTHNKFMDKTGETEEEYVTYDHASNIDEEWHEHLYAKEFLSRNHPIKHSLKTTKLPLI